MIASRCSRPALLVAMVVVTGCPVEVSVVPVDWNDRENGGAGGGAPGAMVGCSSFIEVGEPLLLPGATGNAALATIDGASVGVLYRLPSGGGSTVVLQQPFESWPPVSTPPIARTYGPDASGSFHARADGVFVNGGEVLSFWSEGEVAGGPLTGDYFAPRLEPSGDGIFWSSSEMTVYGPTDLDDGSAVLDGEWRFEALDRGGRCVFSQPQSIGPLSLLRFTNGWFQELKTNPPATRTDEAALQLLPWERGLWAVRVLWTPSRVALTIEGLAEVGEPLPSRELALPPAPSLSLGRAVGFRGGALSVYVQDPPSGGSLVLALTDGEHLTLAEVPSSDACVNAPGVATSPTEGSVLVATAGCGTDGGSVIRRFDCVE